MGTPIHQSLLRQPYFLDVPREVLILEALFVLGWFLVLGAGFEKFLILGLLLVPLHLCAAHLSRDDHEALPLLFDALRYRRFYPAQATLLPAGHFEPRSSLPKL